MPVTDGEMHSRDLCSILNLGQEVRLPLSAQSECQKRIDPQSSSRGFKRNMLVLTLCAQIIRAVDWVSISLCFLFDREVSR